MGLDILAFACSIDAFTRVYGCREMATYEKILQSDDSSVRHYLRLDDQGPSGQSERARALLDIFQGVTLDSFEPSTYGYALVGALHVLGQFLGSNGGSSGRQMYADSALRKMGENTSALPGFGVDWPMGGISVPDWPMVQMIGHADVVSRAAMMTDLMTRVTSEHLGAKYSTSYDFLVSLTAYYTEAAALKQDLILVAH